MSITANRTAEIFQTLRFHYESPKYDYFLYNGRLKKQPQNPHKNFDGLAARLITQDKVEDFFASNIVDKFIKNNSIPNYIGEYCNRESLNTMNKWKQIQSEQQQIIKEHVKTKTRLKILLFSGENMPIIYNDVYDGKTSIDTVSNILYYYPSILKKWTKFENDPLFNSLHNIVMRHQIFLKNKKYICENLNKIFENLNK